MNKEPIKENKRFVINLPRKYGKMTFALQSFYADCKNKKRTVLRMPEGDVYSPEALKNLLKAQNQDLLKKIDKIKAYQMTEKSFENLPNKRGIWYAGFSEAKKKIKQLLK